VAVIVNRVARKPNPVRIRLSGLSSTLVGLNCVTQYTANTGALSNLHWLEPCCIGCVMAHRHHGRCIPNNSSQLARHPGCVWCIARVKDKSLPHRASYAIKKLAVKGVFKPLLCKHAREKQHSGYQ